MLDLLPLIIRLFFQFRIFLVLLDRQTAARFFGSGDLNVVSVAYLLQNGTFAFPPTADCVLAYAVAHFFQSLCYSVLGVYALLVMPDRDIVDVKMPRSLIHACSVTGSLANGVTTSGEIKSAGGIAGTAYGAKIYDTDGEGYNSGGHIIGCGVRTFVSYAENSGGTVGTATAHSNSTYIKSCYAANIYLNGKNNGGIAGADGTHNPHRIAYCLVDNANAYTVIVGDNVRSVSKTMVLSIPADSGLTVDGVLSVLNSASSGYSNWTRSDDKNGGYPYPSKIILQEDNNEQQKH